MNCESAWTQDFFKDSQLMIDVTELSTPNLGYTWMGAVDLSGINYWFTVCLLFNFLLVITFFKDLSLEYN